MPEGVFVGSLGRVSRGSCEFGRRGCVWSPNLELSILWDDGDGEVGNEDGDGGSECANEW